MSAPRLDPIPAAAAPASAPRVVYLNGEYLPADVARVSPDDRGFLFGDGVYEVTPAYGGRFFRLGEHLTRLRRNLGEVRIGDTNGGADALAAEVGEVSRELLARNGLDGAARALVYAQVTRGAAWPRTHAFPREVNGRAARPTVYAYAAAWAPKFDAAAGATAVTVPDVRWSRCDIKSIALLANCLAAEAAREAGVHEALFVRGSGAEAVALEGTHTNLFAVAGGVVWTHPAAGPDAGHVLPGVTRDAVLALCRAHGVPCREAPLPARLLAEADELFLTGTTTEVTPLVRVDGRPVGAGVPGPVTAHLRALFLGEVARATAGAGAE